MRRRALLVAGGLLALTLGLPGQALAQEADVREAVSATLETWSTGDFDRFAEFYHPKVRGFFLDGGVLAEGFDVAALKAAHEEGLRTDLDLRDLTVEVHGTTAVSAGYLDGSIGLPGGLSLEGSWRYSDTRILEGGVWKVVQYHFSQLATGF
ncbi:MAG: YybH family protein [Longimicrobiales bacterium]